MTTAAQHAEARRWWGKPVDGVYTRAEGGFTWTLKPSGHRAGWRWFLGAPNANLIDIVYGGGLCGDLADAKDGIERYLAERERRAAQQQAYAAEKATARAFVAEHGEANLVARLAKLKQERDDAMAMLTRLAKEWGALHQTLELAGVSVKGGAA